MGTCRHGHGPGWAGFVPVPSGSGFTRFRLRFHLEPVANGFSSERFYGSAVQAGSEPVANGSGFKWFGTGSVPGNPLRGHP